MNARQPNLPFGLHRCGLLLALAEVLESEQLSTQVLWILNELRFHEVRVPQEDLQPSLRLLLNRSHQLVFQLGAREFLLSVA